MVYLWSGKTGSGKSKRMVKRAFKRWLRGETIFTNINLYFKKSWYHNIWYKQIRNCPTGRIIRFETLDEILDAKDGTIVFDDAGVLFNAKSWESIPIEFVHKLQLSRHHRLDLFCSVPNILSVHIDYRRLVQKWYYCVRIFQIGKRSSWIGAYYMVEKDIDYIQLANEDALSPNEDRLFSFKIYFIGLWSKRLYDTFADISFRRFKIIWTIPEKDRSSVWIIPKELSLSEGQRLMFQLEPKLKSTKSLSSLKS